MQLDPDHISTLCSIGNVEPETAKKLLLKHDGSLEKAVDACLSGDRGEAAALQEISSSQWSQRNNTPDRGFYDSEPPPLTMDPQLATSSQHLVDLNDVESGTKFGPSTRAPNPDWQMVPSDVAVGGRASTPIISQEDQSLNDAIQRSLDDFQVAGEKDDDFVLKEKVREGGRPVAVRPEVPTLACAALVVQALYYIPQVRFAVANLRLPDIEEDLSPSHPARVIWSLIELFTNMDLAQLSVIVDSEVLPNIELEPNQVIPTAIPADNATAVINKLTGIIEAHITAQQEDDENAPKLFSFNHLHVNLSSRLPSQLRKTGRINSGGVVRVDIGSEHPERDLVSRLAAMLSIYQQDGSSGHDLITEPAEMLVFSLHRYPSPSKNEGDTFVYPKTFFLDRFLHRNLDITQQKMTESRRIMDEISELSNRRMTLSGLNQRDTIQDLKNTIYYYENVAQAKDDPPRQREIQSNIAELKDILLMLESKIAGYDQRIKQLEEEASLLFECPELEHFQYDLRAVLIHSGLPGRKQVYSYVQDSEGSWWRTCDHEVSPASEQQVLTDVTGVHLGAGPFMVMYSKHLSEEDLRKPAVWPPTFANEVEENNRRFLAMLSPEVAAKARYNAPTAISSPKYASPSPRRAPPPLPQRIATPPRAPTQPVMGPRPSGSGHNRAGSSLSIRSMDASNDGLL